MSIEKILVVDSDPFLRDLIADTFQKKQLDVTSIDSFKKSLQALQENSFDLAIIAIDLPDGLGMDLLNCIKEQYPQILVVILSPIGDVKKTAEAMQTGAFSCLHKPFSVDALEAIIQKAREHLSLVEENRYLRHQISTGGSQATLKVIGESPIMKQILAEVRQVANSHASVLISGESGTGKEVIANVIHYSSPRAHHPFIKVNCAAMPETLIESELFGHEKGAFTGANAKRLGRFELAHRGSLLLDEITEIPLALQAKLLRAVQEQEFERVGGNKVIKVDVRIISTSNRDVKEALANRLLREDLYYRLNVVPIHIPPLRERREDIIPLAEYFMEKISIDNKKMCKELSSTAKKKLLEYSWPGNIRELANIIERAVVLDISPSICAEHLLLDALSNGTEHNNSHPNALSLLPVGTTLQELEQQLILTTLQSCDNNRTKAAEILGISLRTLHNKLSKIEVLPKTP
jgi:two-component system response regulator AtoC